jgi:opacity protein-like surface antigen
MVTLKRLFSYSRFGSAMNSVYGKGRNGRTGARAWTAGVTGCCLAAALLASLPATATAAESTEPAAGIGVFSGGLTIPNTGLTLGGYATASFVRLKHEPSRLALDNTSLFLWWDGGGRWKLFSELDYENLLRSRISADGRGKRYLALERAYADYAFSDSASLRLGKFLTPIGRWNLIHATPLVWTTSRPLITTQVFPDNATGLMVNGTAALAGKDVDYSVYASHGGDFRANPDQDPFSDSFGAHVAVQLPMNVQLGGSLAEFEQQSQRDEKKRLLGLDFFWSHNRYELTGEGVYRYSDKGGNWDERGAFVQLAVPLSLKLYAVGRYEFFRQALEPDAVWLWVAGLNYRLTPGVVLKAEWVGSENNHIGAPTGFMSSLSILF